MTKLGFAWMPRSAREGIELAQAIEEGGFWGLGVSDSPILYADVYPVISACLEHTSRISVGPNVVNTVSRHWTVHSASARAFEELYPGRYHLCAGSGDGSVHSVGLRPASLRQLGDDVANMRKATPTAVPIRLAASGPRAAAVAGRVADAVILGTGMDVGAIDALSLRARQARADAGISKPLEVWAQIPLLIADDGQVEAARRSIAHLAVSYGRFAFARTFEDKNVPEHLQAAMSEGFTRYSLAHHATVEPSNPNASLFDGSPEVIDYLVDRMTLVDTAERCAERIEQFIHDTGVDGVNLVVIVADPVDTVRRAAEAFAGLTKAQ